jgi:hypothetical protein
MACSQVLNLRANHASGAYAQVHQVLASFTFSGIGAAFVWGKRWKDCRVATAAKICGGFVAFGIAWICRSAANVSLTLGHKALQFQQLPQPGIGSKQPVRESRPLRLSLS